MPINLESERIYIGRIDSSKTKDDVGGYALLHERPLSTRPLYNDILYHGFDRGRIVTYLQAIGAVVQEGRFEVVNGIEMDVPAARDAGLVLSKLPEKQFHSIIDDADLVGRVSERSQASENNSRVHVNGSGMPSVFGH